MICELCWIFAGNTIDDDKFSVSTLIEKANKNVGMFAPQGLAIGLSGSKYENFYSAK